MDGSYMYIPGQFGKGGDEDIIADRLGTCCYWVEARYIRRWRKDVILLDANKGIHKPPSSTTEKLH